MGNKAGNPSAQRTQCTLIRKEKNFKTMNLSCRRYSLKNNIYVINKTAENLNLINYKILKYNTLHTFQTDITSLKGRQCSVHEKDGSEWASKDTATGMGIVGFMQSKSSLHVVAQFMFVQHVRPFVAGPRQQRTKCWAGLKVLVCVQLQPGFYSGSLLALCTLPLCQKPEVPENTAHTIHPNGNPKCQQAAA